MAWAASSEGALSLAASAVSAPRVTTRSIVRIKRALWTRRKRMHDSSLHRRTHVGSKRGLTLGQRAAARATPPAHWAARLAQAAPLTPRDGRPHHPGTSKRSPAMLIRLIAIVTVIGVIASPRPRR